jgi:hypothetical protein
LIFMINLDKKAKHSAVYTITDVLQFLSTWPLIAIR